MNHVAEAPEGVGSWWVRLGARAIAASRWAIGSSGVRLSSETWRKLAVTRQHGDPSGGRGRWAGARRRAFTLLEMVIVIVIILALGGIVLVNLIGTQEQAEKDTARIQIDSFEAALSQFRVVMHRWPTEEEGLKVLWSKDGLEDEADASKWRAFLAEPKPMDDWGSQWIYQQPSRLRDGADYDIISPGPDRQPETDDDITNHTGKAATGESGGDEFGDFAPPTGGG
jgi:general secretion pathway protein G